MENNLTLRDFQQRNGVPFAPLLPARLAGGGVFLALLLCGICPTFGAELKALPGHVPKILSSLAPKGRLAATNQLRLAIGLPPRDPAGLENFVTQVSDPAGPNFRHFLTREELTARFGPTEQDYEAVKNFARTNGLTIAMTHGNRLLLDVTGPATAIENAFHVKLQTYRHPTETRDFFAPDAEPKVDAALPVADVGGLNNFWRPHPKRTRSKAAHAVAKNGTAPDGSGNLFGNDFRNAYAPGTPLTGAGQSVGLMEFDGYFANDIFNYANLAGNGRTNIVIETVLLDGYDGKPSTGSGGGEAEVELDIEMAMAIAPGLARIVTYEAGENGNHNDVLNAMLANGSVLNLSCSWSWNGPSATTDAIFQSMAAVGQTFFNASGDSGAFTTGSNSVNGVDNPATVNAPSSNPQVTQVGGTTLQMNGAGVSRASEVVWNWGLDASGDYLAAGSGASSGGVSSYYSIPAWQTNVSNLSGRGGSTGFRNVPDVAANADNVYEIFDNGRNPNDYDGNGGTSAAAPLWAGFMALVNQQLSAAGRPSAGFINPALYAIAAGSNYQSCFNDVTSGNNAWSGSPNLFYAAGGYDLCTGLGTMKGTNLINALAAAIAAPAIITPPQPQTVIQGGNSLFSVTAGSTTPMTYQWYYSTNTLTGWGFISGATGSTLTLNNVQATNAGYYLVIVKNTYGSVISASARLTITNGVAPGIIGQPIGSTNAVGGSAVFNVTATGTAPLTYQWYYSLTGTNGWHPILTDTNSTATLNNLQLTNSAYYCVIVNNAYGSQTSAFARLTVTNGVAPNITGQPVGSTNFVGGRVAFGVSATGTAPLTYQWYYSLTGINGWHPILTATNSTVTLTNLQLTNTAYYCVIVNNAFGSQTSVFARLSVIRTLFITGTTNVPAAPNSTNAVWVTTYVSSSTNISAVTLTYDAGGGPTNVTMFDDGLHHDGAAGDGTYGGQIPAFPEAATVRYYVTASNALNLLVADPASAPTNSYSYAVLSSDVTTPFAGSIVLGRPTDHSIVVSVLATNNLQFYLEYGLAPGVYPNQTAVTNVVGGLATEVFLNQLSANTRYYYRMHYKGASDTNYLTDARHTFITQRPPGSAFTFCIHGDSHPERTNNMYDPNFYQLTLNTAAADQPDFYMTVGDDFSVDQIGSNNMSQAQITYRYTLQRGYLGLVGNSAPIFLVNGNHEQASRANFINRNLIAPGVNTVTFSNIAVWAQTARNAYFPEPAPDDFYGGMTNDVLPGIGSLRSCYSWTWGDALFVTIDPYWYSTNCVDNGFDAQQHPTSDTWLLTHGDEQYFWLKSTLERSRAKYKFVFAHHVMGTGRGGIECAQQFEFGGENHDGTWGFATNRPYWPDPIHQLMVANNVTAFVQGHDHIFVRQQLDGLTYQTLPNPADNHYSLFNSGAYTENLLYKTNNTGYTRFTISPTGAKVEYVRTILPTNLVLAAVGTNAAPPGVTNGQVDYSYVLYPLTAAGTANSPVTPSPTNAVWVTTAIAAGTNVSQVTLTYLANGLTNTVPLLDDGLHHDGAAGDGVYGAQLPAQPLGTLVRYFVHAVDAATRQLTDPSGAPLNPNLYSYTVGAVTDSVGDGIADSWRAQYFGGDGTTTNAASAATADPDGDGFSNYQEYLAGTNPTNALSCFHILSIDATPGQPVRFQSATNRTYTLYVRTNLLGGAWTAVPGQSNVPGTGGLMSLTNPLSADTERFFRISVQ